MEALGISLFLVTALVGSYVQSVTGFAMGMIMIAVMVGSGLVAVPVITAVVSVLSLLNILLALHGHLHHVERRLLLWMSIGLPVAVWGGVEALEVMDRQVAWLLELLLGSFIVLGSLSMMLRPQPRRTLSRPWACLTAGLAGGMLGGLFSASGPVLGWFTYRQPLTVAEIRTTLLAVFAFTTSLRIGVVGVGGGLTGEVWLLSLLGVPLVLLGTWLGRSFAPPLSDVALKRVAFGILLLMGSWMVVRALWLS
jgi:uncharacterized membrane protein YfcA